MEFNEQVVTKIAYLERQIERLKTGEGGGGGGLVNACRVRASSSQSISDSTSTVVLFDLEDYDNNEMHSTSTNTGQIVCKVAGLYHIFANIRLAGNVNGNRIFNIRLNGTYNLASIRFEPIDQTGKFDALCLSSDYELAVDDYIEVIVWQESGSSISTETNDYANPVFGITYLGKVS